MPRGETTFWGSVTVGIDRLAAYRDADVICFDHGNAREMAQLMATPLWRAMPFVRAGHFQRVPAVSMARRYRRCILPACWPTLREARHEIANFAFGDTTAVDAPSRRCCADAVQPQRGAAAEANGGRRFGSRISIISLRCCSTTACCRGWRYRCWSAPGWGWWACCSSRYYVTRWRSRRRRRGDRGAAGHDGHHAVGDPGVLASQFAALAGACIVGALVFGVSWGKRLAGDVDSGRAGGEPVLRRA